MPHNYGVYNIQETLLHSDFIKEDLGILIDEVPYSHCFCIVRANRTLTIIHKSFILMK